MVEPLRLFTNGSVCATLCAYHGASKLSTTITTNSAPPASATRSRRKRRHASAHGPRATTLGSTLSASATGGSASANSAICSAYHWSDVGPESGPTYAHRCYFVESHA